MSLMSDTQGTPERVWSLVSLLRAHGGKLEREGVRVWLDPFETDSKGTAVQQTIGAAASLDLVESDRAGGTVRLLVDELPETQTDFTDWVHAKLVNTHPEDANSVVLDAYAWFIANSGKEKGTTWAQAMSTDALTERIRVDLTPEGEEGRFNKTRYPRWRDWIAFMGLGIDLPLTGGKAFYPYATARFEREMGWLRKQFGTGQEIAAEAFLDAVVRRMPYLDLGDLFQTAASRIRWSPPQRQLSIVFSTALRELDDEGVLELKMYGDAPNAFTLHYDQTRRKEAFVSVVLNPVEGGNG